MTKPNPIASAKKVRAPSIPPKQKDRSAVDIRATGAEDTYAAIARTLTRPEIGAAAVLEKWSADTYDVNVLAAELGAQVKAVNDGSLQRAEGMLIAQAHTLDAIFVNLMRRATTQTMLPQWEAYMRMGMKAQSQCRATLEALGELKNPRAVSFVKQANINNGGQQQVNNGQPPPVAQVEETRFQQTKLLEAGHGQPSGRMDTGAQKEAVGGNTAMEAVGKVNRAKKSRG